LINSEKKHKSGHRLELIIISRKRNIKGVNEDCWIDVVIGIKCIDCPKKIAIVEKIITKYPYSGKPNFPTMGPAKAEKIIQKKKNLKDIDICTLKWPW